MLQSLRTFAISVVASTTIILVGSLSGYGPAEAAEPDPDATPEIIQVKPPKAFLGQQTTLTITGKNFSRGVYVSFSTPFVSASTDRRSDTDLAARVEVNRSAQPGNVSLFVSNTGSTVAEVPFAIEAPGGPVAAGTTSADASGTTSGQPGGAGNPQTDAPQGAAPEITKVDPPIAPRGGQLDIKVAGKNFGKGAKVVFANPGIQVLSTDVKKDSELVARVQVKSDAKPGETSLFLVNPDEQEAEAKFVLSEEVTAQAAPATPSAPATTQSPSASGSPSTPAASAPAPAKSTAAQRFEVYNLADVASIIQARNAPKGTLITEGGKLRLEEAGKEVFSVAASDVKEIALNMMLGINTGTFHIFLNSGKSYNFAALSLRPTDTQSLIDSLRNALK